MTARNITLTAFGHRYTAEGWGDERKLFRFTMKLPNTDCDFVGLVLDEVARLNPPNRAELWHGKQEVSRLEFAHNLHVVGTLINEINARLAA